MKPPSEEFLARKAENKQKLQDALANVITTHWIEYDVMHRAVNKAMGKDNRGREIDLEFITLNAALGEFDKTRPLEWLYERKGPYAAQQVAYVRLLQDGGAE